jgi:hypothetical protein
MKLPDHLFRYLLITAIILISGITVVLIQTAVANPGLAPLDPAALQARADYHTNTVMPFMANAFPGLLFLNVIVALFILMVPLFGVWTWWIRKDLPDMTITFMKGTVCLLIWAVGHNSFTRIYITYRQLSWQMIATMYLPHGWLEMLAFVLAGTSSFLCIDALGTYLQENGNSHTLRPRDISLFMLGRMWKPGLLIFFLMAIAAAVECRVTPVLLESAFEAALLTSAR